MSRDEIDDYYLVELVFGLRKEDPLGTVMRGQMRIEQELRRFIQSTAASASHANLDESDFQKTVQLALILGLDAHLKPALVALGALRNKFVRSPDLKLGKQETDNFYNALSPELKNMMREVYIEFKSEEGLPEFKRQPPLDQLIWFIVGIWSAVFANRKHGSLIRSRMRAVPQKYVQDLQGRQSALFQLLEEDNDLGMVIRAHIHLEHELREFIQAAAPQPLEKELAEYNYSRTLRLAMTLGLDPALEGGLIAVGRLRNKFAHRLEMKLTDNEAKLIYSALDSNTQAEAQQAWSAAYVIHPDSGRPKELLRSSPKDLIATSMLMLWSGVVLRHVTLRSNTLKRL